MKCPTCTAEMIKGVLNSVTWLKGERVKGFLPKKRTTETTVIAWNCPKCKKIELSEGDTLSQG